MYYIHKQDMKIFVIFVIIINTITIRLKKSKSCLEKKVFYLTHTHNIIITYKKFISLAVTQLAMLIKKDILTLESQTTQYQTMNCKKVMNY